MERMGIEIEGIRFGEVAEGTALKTQRTYGAGAGRGVRGDWGQ